ncbi:MAG: hypothetical protein JJU29_15365 [Verrucomicrobia bacterium]|nr:hypothetical protein [Verrucomicrobiota bacterium]MCH8512459.1 hypothetical protein [Kiritimatiellia bacterium]
MHHRIGFLTRRASGVAFCMAISLVMGLVDPLFAQEEGLNLDEAAGGNIGRTESDDGHVEPELDMQFGRLGVVTFPVSFETAGVATLALYTPEGRLVRILAQAVEVEPGESTIRWDGLDLFGHPVLANTDLELRIFHNANLKVTYEMSVNTQKVAPWPGSFERDGERFSGGWLGDHSAPNSVAAIGDLLMIGAPLAEEGDNIAVIDPEGRKRWGAKLQGWDGVSLLKAGSDAVYAINRRRNAVFRIEAEQREVSPGRFRLERGEVFTAPDLQHIAVHGEDLLAVSLNPVSRLNPTRNAFGNGDIDFARSRPQVTGTTAPTEFTISPRAGFANTFTDAGNPQNGVQMIWHNGAAYLLIVLNEEKTLGTVVLPRMADAEKVEVHVLKTGVEYEESMSPLSGGDDTDITQLRLTDVSEEWEVFGETVPRAELNFVAAPERPVRTRAFMIRAVPSERGAGSWTPRIPMARVLAERVRETGGQPESVRFETLLAEDRSADFAGLSGWQVRTEYPISAIYPLHVITTYAENQRFNTLAVYNAVNPELWIDALREGVDPDAASDEDWVELGRIRGSGTRHLGAHTASRHGYERFLNLDQSVETRALRFRMHRGYQGGKWGQGRDDSYLGENRHVALLTTESEQSTAPSHQLHWVNVTSKERLGHWIDDQYALRAMDFAPDGTLYTVADGRLNRTELNRQTGGWTHVPVGDLTFGADSHISLDVNEDRILVGDRTRNQILVLDREGRELKRIGTGDGREPGPWNPYVIGRPSAVAQAANGEIWVAEELFAPKRIARFSADGSHIEDFFGPSMYGGGGRLDPTLTRFFYRSKEFELDWETGESRLLNLNDRAYHPQTPDAGTHTFAFTSIGRPVFYRGNRYLTSGFTVVRKPDDSPVWRPAMVAGAAHESPFLLGKEVWNRHWAKLDLSDKFFVWIDHNDDGEYQVEEVQLMDRSELPRMRGPTRGNDLSIWGADFRWAPRGFTPGGNPIFDLNDVTPFDYAELAPHYNRNYTVSGPRSAKPGYGGFRYVSTEGNLAQEGQPFVVQADGTILGGPPPEEASDYVPPIVGQVVQTAWSWAGGAMTESDVGEIAIINSFRGPWHLWAVDHGVMLGRIFTGEQGTFNGMEPVRGTDVTRRHFGWEGWHADFVKGHDGNYYAQGGKSFHSISRVHGVDDFTLRTQSHRVTPEAHALVAPLREILVQRANANGGRNLQARPVNQRLTRFNLDGELEDWGDRRAFTFIDEDTRTTRFDMSYNDEGMIIAIDGNGNLEGEVDDWRQAHREGFAIDLQFRGGDGRNRSPNLLPGDKRIFIVKHRGEWRGVLWQPEHPKGPTDNDLRVNSPYMDLHAHEVRLLGTNELQIKIRELTLDIDLGDLGGGGFGDGFDGMDTGLQLRGEEKAGNEKQGDGQDWSAEIFVPWNLIGGGPGERRMDLGIREAGPEGRVIHWNNRHPYTGNDPALQADLHPGGWGRVNFQRTR